MTTLKWGVLDIATAAELEREGADLRMQIAELKARLHWAREYRRGQVDSIAIAGGVDPTLVAWSLDARSS